MTENDLQGILLELPSWVADLMRQPRNREYAEIVFELTRASFKVIDRQNQSEGLDNGHAGKTV